ncbi:MAG: carbohydrate kinase [Clostridiaceae bacterium]|nr:carbohydrate kinase [Clostridiaceae bacterium]
MILSVGEILCDLIGETDGNVTSFVRFAGGAPFNVACNAHFAGAESAFVGKVGRDVMGDFLLRFADSLGFDRSDIKVDKRRNTTLAFVEIRDGEREFTFFRNNTADYNLKIDEIDFSKYKGLSILHLGSLMLSELTGRNLAKNLIKAASTRGLKISFDVNFRSDIFGSPQKAIAAYTPLIEAAHILKFSESELADFTEETKLAAAVAKLARPGRLLAVTLGKDGSLFSFNGITEVVPTIPVKAVDTTGAGDAFYGALLAKVDAIGLDNLTHDDLIAAFVYANRIGAIAVQKKGAINSF